MSPWLPRVTADQILRVLRRLGFEGVRSRASASTAPAFPEPHAYATYCDIAG
jgi:hypothetical protein